MFYSLQIDLCGRDLWVVQVFECHHMAIGSSNKSSDLLSAGVSAAG